MNSKIKRTPQINDGDVSFKRQSAPAPCTVASLKEKASPRAEA